MVKAKHKKQNLSDKVRSKKNSNKDKVNPFEVKINKQKHEVLNKKVSKFDKGRPGVSRSRAIKKRTETLLVEYQKRGKTNTLLDKRFGENAADLSVEEKMLQRFALERKKHHEKPGAFSLQEDDTLTHYGQSLAEIEKFEDPMVSDDEDDEDRGKISGKLVAEEHFGGGTLTKSSEGDTGHKTWKERMEEVIAKSKKEKYERQHEKEKTRAMTEQLDNEWKELRLTMVSSLKKNDTREEVKKTVDEYDITVRELQFEMKGQASDRLKTEEEIAKEEKEKLENLEAERVRRMKGEVSVPLHRSADDLDDGFKLQSSEQSTLSYKEGKMVRFEDQQGSDGDEGSGGESEQEEELSDDSEEEDSEDAADDLSDLESDPSDLEASEDEQEKDESGETSEKSSKDEEAGKSIMSKSGSVKEIREMLLKKKHEMDEARQQLPYTFPAPDNYSDLVNLLSGYHDIDQVIIIERLRACHHPSLAEGNKDKLEKLFSLLLQFYCEQCLASPPKLRLLDKLLPHLYELCRQSPLAGKVVLDLVMEKQQDYTERCKARGGKGHMPTLDVLMLLKLVSILFPTSDRKHPVVTPAFLYISQILTQSGVQTTRDVAVGLFVCNLVLEYVSFSKRFVPEVINFLNGVLFLTIDKDSQTIHPVIPPFKPVGKYNNLLQLATDQSEEAEVGQMKLGHIFTPQKAFSYLASDEFRLCAIQLAVSLLHQFSSLYDQLPSFPEIFSPVQYFVKKLPTEKYPQSLQKAVRSLSEALETGVKKPRKPVKLDKQPAKALKLYEPKLTEGFDPSRKERSGGREKNEKQRLVHKHKKELKGAVREVRKDAQFIAKHKLDEQIQRDSERKRKVQALMGNLASQEGDFNSLKRKKNKL